MLIGVARSLKLRARHLIKKQQRKPRTKSPEGLGGTPRARGSATSSNDERQRFAGESLGSTCGPRRDPRLVAAGDGDVKAATRNRLSYNKIRTALRSMYEERDRKGSSGRGKSVMLRHGLNL